MSTKTTSITVLVKEPGKDPYWKTIQSNLKSMQGIVGGYIERLEIASGVAIILNEEGKLVGLPHNFNFSVGGYTHCIVGTVFFTDQNMKSFDVDKAKIICRYMHWPYPEQ